MHQVPFSPYRTVVVSVRSYPFIGHGCIHVGVLLKVRP